MNDFGSVLYAVVKLFLFIGIMGTFALLLLLLSVLFFGVPEIK